MGLTISHNAREGAEIFGAVSKRVVRRSMIRAQGKLMQQLRTRISRDTRQETGVTQKVIKPRFHIPRRAPKNYMFVGTAPIQAIDLKARQLKRGKGVSFKDQAEPCGVAALLSGEGRAAVGRSLSSSVSPAPNGYPSKRSTCRSTRSSSAPLHDTCAASPRERCKSFSLRNSDSATPA